MTRAIVIFFATFALALAQDAKFPLESLAVNGSQISQETIRGLTGLSIGDPIDKAALETASRKLAETGLFQTVNYTYAPGPNRGYALTLILADQPVVKDAVVDLPGVDENEVWKWLVSIYPAFDRRVPAVGVAQDFLAHEIEKHFSDQLKSQHVAARQEQEFVPKPRQYIAFQPDVLPITTAIFFQGSQEFSSSELEHILEPVAVNQEYTPKRFAQYVSLNLGRAYETRGMYRVQFQSTAKRTGPGSMEVTTAVEECPKYKLGDVRLEGENLPVEKMLAAAHFRKGEVANWAEIQKGIYELERPVRRTGYMNAAAEPVRDLQDTEHILNLTIRVHKGPLYHFGRVEFAGLSPNLAVKAQEAWKMRAGDIYDYGYPNDFLREFARSNDFRQYQCKMESRAGAGENVQDLTLVFEPK